MAPSLQFAQKTASPGQALQTLEALRPVLGKDFSGIPQKEIDLLLMIFGSSGFFSRWAQLYPEKIPPLLQIPLEKTFRLKDFVAELKTLLPDLGTLDRAPLSTALSDFKYRHLFRITRRDLSGQVPFVDIVAELSDLARSIVQTALAWHEHDFAREWGVPHKKGARHPIPYAVIAMGKLGGNELNFSSDLDLIYIYGSDHGHLVSQGKGETLSPHEYFTKLSEKLTQFLNQKTGRGFLYRIDLELRPEGKAGALANSIDAMEKYYETFGADWEKQAMLKAGWTAGSEHLLKDFLHRIHPFVYPKSTSMQFLSSIRDMKEKVMQAVRENHPETFHVKLGDGGIREIEFFVQSMQVLFGGNVASLQTPNTLEALERLYQAKLIEEVEKEKLHRAYLFLRTLEHRLQLVEEQQTHLMPSTGVELNQLARRMGYLEENADQARERMLSDLEGHRRHVMDTFNDLLSHRFGEY